MQYGNNEDERAKARRSKPTGRMSAPRSRRRCGLVLLHVQDDGGLFASYNSHRKKECATETVSLTLTEPRVTLRCGSDVRSIISEIIDGIQNHPDGYRMKPKGSSEGNILPFIPIETL